MIIEYEEFKRQDKKGIFIHSTSFKDFKAIKETFKIASEFIESKDKLVVIRKDEVLVYRKAKTCPRCGKTFSK